MGLDRVADTCKGRVRGGEVRKRVAVHAREGTDLRSFRACVIAPRCTACGTTKRARMPAYGDRGQETSSTRQQSRRSTYLRERDRARSNPSGRNGTKRTGVRRDPLSDVDRGKSESERHCASESHGSSCDGDADRPLEAAHGTVGTRDALEWWTVRRSGPSGRRGGRTIEGRQNPIPMNRRGGRMSDVADPYSQGNLYTKDRPLRY
jgi:hypothetical protein